MTSLMSCDYGNTDKIVLEIMECEEMGIKVLPPSVNESFKNFTYVDDKTIRFGLAAIKGIGDDPATEIINVRGEKPFENLEDFVHRVPPKVVNKKLIEALAYSGAMDEFGDRKQIAESTEEISTYAKIYNKTKVEGQTDIFGMMDEEEDAGTSSSFALKQVEPATEMEKLKWEKDYLGLYVSSHPLQGLSKYFAKKAHLIKNLKAKDIGKKIFLGGLVTQYRKIFTKSGAYMASFIIEDPTGKFDVIVFPKAYQQYGHLFHEDAIVVMSGKISDKRGQVQFVCDEAKALTLESMIENAKKDNLYDPNEKIVQVRPELTKEKSEDEENELPAIDDDNNEPFIIKLPKACSPNILNDIKKILLNNKGDTPCEIHIPNNGSSKRIRVPFGVKADDDLRSSVQDILTKECPV
jgi:DNA polymerase-3 subunit alpha